MKLKSDTQEMYTPDIGDVPANEIVECGVCGEKMDEERNHYGPRGFVQAMAKSKSRFDIFSCPNRELGWHKQAIALRQERNNTASRHLADIFEQEAQAIIATKTATIAKFQ
jgi:formylmethanofuran dehydrogenase subunit E